MNKKVLEYYDYYEDIQPKLCEYIGIDQKDFRGYHNVVGGDYKDFWHVFLWINNNSNISNDSYFSLFSEEIQKVGDTWDNMLLHYDKSKYADEEWEIYKTWAKPLWDAIDQLHIDYGNKITIWISW